MVSENIKKFVKSIQDDDPDEAEKYIEKIIQEKEENRGSENIEDLSGLGSERASRIREHGYESIESIAKASLRELVEVPKIGKKSAQSILESAHEEVENILLELPGVGSDKAEEIRKAGYCSLETLANSSLEDLEKIPKVGKESAKEILNAARKIWGKEERIEGYRRALKGALKGLKSDRVLTYARRIAEDRYSDEQLKEFKKEMKERSSQEFRPPDERGYCEGWADILEALNKNS